MTSFYELVQPTQWATPPEMYSFSSLQEIEGCPRRWQLLRSTWGEQSGYPQRPHPKAVEGRIVHEAIELLVRALGARGLPAIGSTGFQDAVREIDFWGLFARETTKWNERLAQHPRFGPHFVLRTPPRELANQAIRMFREQYVPSVSSSSPAARPDATEHRSPVNVGQLLRSRGALAEVRVEHPELPFVGIIDLVRLDGSEVDVVDFKTGKAKEGHERQVLLYGVLWWRVTGEAPSKVSLQYLGARRTWTVTPDQLEVAEEKLGAAIDAAGGALSEHPATARPGDGCRFCPARARCDEGWGHFLSTSARVRSGISDVEATVASAPSEYGFLATRDGKEVDVVFDAAVGRRLPPLAQGDVVRMLDCVVKDEGKTFEIRPWTEVFPTLSHHAAHA
ncbi:MAG: PD-(D/E)XK nuclease family protein [Alphaproteobacteria bacterium]|nr:PD-(D/E)XK nuclease family protein [Alphaproteobacteria bacterium]